MKALYTLLLLICFTACTPNLDKALKVALKDDTNATVTQTKLNSSYPIIVANNAAQLFPVRETVVTKTDTLIETVTIPGETINCPETIHKETGKVYTPTVKCPDHSYELKTIKELTERTQESTARVEALTLERDAALDSTKAEQVRHKATRQALQEAEEKANTYFWGLIAAGLIGIGVIALKFLKPL